MATTLLIFGSTGAGKTTHAMKPSAREEAFRFFLDEWMRQFFWANALKPLTFEWELERLSTASATPCP